MPEIFWACRLILVQETWTPQAYAIIDALGPHDTAWSTTEGHRQAPYAVGASVVSAAQLSALLAEPAVYVVEDTDWVRTFGDLPGQVRARVNAFCTQVGVAQPETNEVLRDLMTRMTQIIDHKAIDTHLEQVRGQAQGRAARSREP